MPINEKQASIAGMDPKWILATLAASHSLSKAAPIFVEKISNALTGLVAPWQLKRMAEAQAEVTILQKEADASGNIAALELYERAGYRSAAEEMKRQLNIEAITKGAIPLLQDEAKPQNIDNDWIAHFFEKSRLTSDVEMQSLWSRILAGEANAPGTFSKRTVNLVTEISKSEAEAFTKICGFSTNNSILKWLFIYNYDDPIYKNADVSFAQISQLEHAGLVTQAPLVEYQISGWPQRIAIPYFNSIIQLVFPQEQGNTLSVGKVDFSPAGRELSAICGAQIIPGFLEYLLQRWKDFGPTILNVPPSSVFPDPPIKGTPTPPQVGVT